MAELAIGNDLPADSGSPESIIVATSTLKDLNGTEVCEDEMRVTFPSLGRSLELTLIQSEFEIEPIFSGAAWAGSVFWAAAQVLVEKLLLTGEEPVAGRSVLELGCGLGIPGM